MPGRAGIIIAGIIIKGATNTDTSTTNAIRVGGMAIGNTIVDIIVARVLTAGAIIGPIAGSSKSMFITTTAMRIITPATNSTRLPVRCLIPAFLFPSASVVRARS